MPKTCFAKGWRRSPNTLPGNHDAFFLCLDCPLLNHRLIKDVITIIILFIKVVFPIMKKLSIQKVDDGQLL